MQLVSESGGAWIWNPSHLENCIGYTFNLGAVGGQTYNASYARYGTVSGHPDPVLIFEKSVTCGTARKIACCK